MFLFFPSPLIFPLNILLHLFNLSNSFRYLFFSIVLSFLFSFGSFHYHILKHRDSSLSIQSTSKPMKAFFLSIVVFLIASFFFFFLILRISTVLPPLAICSYMLSPLPMKFLSMLIIILLFNSSFMISFLPYLTLVLMLVQSLQTVEFIF